MAKYSHKKGLYTILVLCQKPMLYESYLDETYQQILFEIADGSLRMYFLKAS